ncbi:MAG: DUF1003 domain-containing protein [Acidimicrobiia bacterium]
MAQNEPTRRSWVVRSGVWHRHPGVRKPAELTLGERAADKLRSGMGSWIFVFGALLFLAGWMVGNRNVGFDPYPFILLNLLLSCLAALQGAILLIAAKRSDQIASELAQHDFDTDTAAARRIEEVLARLEEQGRHDERRDAELRRILDTVLARLDGPADQR